MSICLETSAIVAIILDEPTKLFLLEELAESEDRFCPTNCVLEAIIVLVRRQRMTPAQAKELVFGLLHDFEVEISTFDEQALSCAIEGYAQFGQGTGKAPAVLNFGDSLAYGVAKAVGGKLLYTGQ